MRYLEQTMVRILFAAAALALLPSCQKTLVFSHNSEHVTVFLGERISMEGKAPVEVTLVSLEATPNQCVFQLKNMTTLAFVSERLEEGDYFSGNGWLGIQQLKLISKGKDFAVLQINNADSSKKCFLLNWKIQQ